MTRLNSSNWPVSYMEQALYVQKIEAEIERLEAAQQTVVVYQATRPTRKEFEQAYVVQTGKPLPIVPGSKLLWWDWASSRARLHTTAYDLVDGTESSGAIYEWSSTKREQGPYRFLGSASGMGSIWNTQFKQVGKTTATSSVSSLMGSAVLEPKFQMQQRLRAIEIFFDFKFNSTATLVLGMVKNRTFFDPTPFGSAIVHNVFDEEVDATPTFTQAARTFVEDDYIELFDVAAAAQDADQRLFGKVTVYNPVDNVDNDGGNEVSNIGNTTYRWEVYSFPTTGAANFIFNHGGGVCRDSYPIAAGITLQMMSLPSTTQHNPASRSWAYGWFDTDYTVNISPLGGFNDVP